MDAKGVQQLLSQGQARCQVLEVDVEVEALRAAKYRNIILGTLLGEGGSRATQPEVSHVPRVVATRRLSPLARLALPAANVGCPNLYCGGVSMLTWMALSHHWIQ